MRIRTACVSAKGETGSFSMQWQTIGKRSGCCRAAIVEAEDEMAHMSNLFHALRIPGLVSKFVLANSQ